MADFLRQFLDIFEKFNRWSIIGAGLLLFSALVVLALGYKKSIEPDQDKFFLFGDPQTEDVQRNIQKIVASSKYPDENLILEQFRNLFVRPGFISYVTGDPRAQLYDFCSARLIIQRYSQYIKTPERKDRVLSAISTLDELTKIEAPFFGDLNVTDHISRYITVRDDFVNKLAPKEAQVWFVQHIAPHEKPLLDKLKQF